MPEHSRKELELHSDALPRPRDHPRQLERRVHVRIGGNTQNYAILVDSLSQGNVTQKLSVDLNNPTATPTLLFTRDLFYMMNNISNFPDLFCPLEL